MEGEERIFRLCTNILIQTVLSRKCTSFTEEYTWGQDVLGQMKLSVYVKGNSEVTQKSLCFTLIAHSIYRKIPIISPGFYFFFGGWGRGVVVVMG